MSNSESLPSQRVVSNPNSLESEFPSSQLSVSGQIAEVYPLSSMQAGMLFQHLYAQQSGVDIEQMVCTLCEPLNATLLEQAWQQVTQRHPILRTSFHWEGLDQPEQRVHEQVSLTLAQQDWRGLAATAQRDRLQSYLQRDRQQSFNFRQAPLMRLALFQVADERYQLVWTFHHILLDGRALPLVLKEVFAIYEALCQGQDCQLEQPCPYRTYIDWLQQQDVSSAEDYWRQLLAGFTASTPLLTERSSPEFSAQPGSGQGEETIRLTAEATTALKALAQQHGITPNTIVQGAWAILLSQYGGTDDVVFGATRACRHSIPGAESIVGLLINTLPVRVKICPDASLLSWLQELRSQQLQIRPYEHTPLTQVQQWSAVPSGMPLFESIVVFENYSLNAALQERAGWKNREFQLFEQPGYPLVLLGNLGVELLLRVFYDRQRFSAATLKQMMQHLQALLERMIAQPECLLTDLSLLTVADRHKILVEWNATEVEYPKQARLHDLFEAQVVQSPDAVAVIFDDQALTYRQLNQQANQLAHYLQKLGIQPEVPVGICIERSLEMIVGLMAIVKAGGAYVPLDPTYPQDRLAHILSDSQLAVVLTQEKFLPLLSDHNLPLVCLDRDWQTIASESTEDPISSVTADHLAYIIYTSGSTGKPKGVLIEHRGAVNTILDINRRFNVVKGDRVLAVCSLNFDLSVYDVFGLLAAGGTVVVPKPAIAPDLDHWLDLMARHQVTIWNSAPPVMQMFAGHIVDRDQALPASLKLVMLSGDWIATTLPNLIRQLWAGVGKLDIISLGGATEASIWSIFYPIEAIDSGWKSIPYGKPLANQQFYILNERHNPVPVGEVGELYIGGDGVARGYLNRPDLNKAKFIPDPFHSRPEARLYRTGDLGRYRPDGNIEFLGRIDHQVKIRGFRVEIGEIEVVLSQHAAIRETAILAQDDPTGNRQLVAYLVVERDYADSGAEELVNEVRSFLQAKLPNYMVPAAFVRLDGLPLTPNGKLDRKALPAPDWFHQAIHSTSSQSFVAAQDQIEQQLVEIWQECLGVQPISVTASFFELGGHSLLAVRLWSKVEKAFHLKLPLATLFQAPTIAQLAERLRQTDLPGTVPTCPSLVVIQPGQPNSVKPPLFCIHVLGRGLKFYRPLVKYLDPQQPVYGLSTHIADEHFSSNQVEALASHYVRQIRTIQPQGPYLLAGVSFGGLTAFEIAQQLLAQGQQVSLLALLDTRLAGAVKALPKSKRLAGHWSHFSEEGLSYFASKLQQSMAARLEKLAVFWRKAHYNLAIKLRELTNRPLNEDLQDFLYEQQNLRSTTGYHPAPYPDLITLFKAQEQLTGVSRLLDPELGWRDIATGGLEIHEIPGSHLGMLQDPSAQVLGDRLRLCIASATGEQVQRLSLNSTANLPEPSFDELSPDINLFNMNFV